MSGLADESTTRQSRTERGRRGGSATAADDESTTARWIYDGECPARWIDDGAQPARRIRVRQPPARQGRPSVAAGEADPCPGPTGEGDEQAAQRGDLERRGEERAAFASAVGEATIWVRDPLLPRDPNM